MPDSTLQQAIREAYASAPSGDVLLETLELAHPAFVDGAGAPDSVRVVLAQNDQWLTLEPAAPVKGGQSVRWIAMAFDLVRPGVGPGGAPELEVVLDGVSREIVQQLDAAMTDPEPIRVTYRAYLASDPGGPQNDPPLSLTLTSVEAGVYQVRGRASLSNFANRAFPGTDFRASDHPALA